MNHKAALFILSSLIGCVGSPVKLTPPSKEAPVVTLEMKSAAAGEAGWQAVAPGAILHSGEKFALKLEASQSLSFYVGQRSAGNEVSLIYPAAPNKSLYAEPGAATFIPKEGGWFRLDDHVGKEVIYVLVSTQQLERNAVLKRLREEPFEITREPPPVVEHRDRGPKVRTVLPKSGIAVLQFPFIHQ